MVKRLSMLLVLSALPAFYLPTSAAGVSAVRANLQSIHMISGLIGWGTDQSRVLHTADGGHTWSNATPALSGGNRFSTGYLSFDALTGTEAFLVAPNSYGRKPPTAAYVFHTSDAGRTWRRLSGVHVSPFEGQASLQFIDRRHGWLTVIRDAGMSQLNFAIFRTVDGGFHWREVLSESSPAGAGPTHRVGGGLPACDCGQAYTYVTPRLGWAAGCYCGLGPGRALFFRTFDGGHTWRPAALPLPRSGSGQPVSLQAPIFFRHGTAAMAAYAGGRFTVYHSSDGGRNWHGVGALKAGNLGDPVSFAGAEHAWFLGERRLYRTVDGGKSWRPVSRALNRQTIMQLQFVTPRVGFALEGIGASSRTRLLETTDSGKTWRQIPAKTG